MKKNFNLTEIGERLHSFGKSFVVAFRKVFNARFCETLLWVLILAFIISTLIVSFTYSKRCGLWCLTAVLIAIGAEIYALLKEERWWKQILIVLGSEMATAAACGIFYLIGYTVLSSIPSANTEYIFEYYMGLGFILSALAAIVLFALYGNYSDLEKKGKISNLLEYLMRVFRNILIVALLIYAICKLVPLLMCLI